MTTFKQKKNNEERRSGKHCRQQNGSSSSGYERRENVGQRKPELGEINLSLDEWDHIARCNITQELPK